MQDWVCFVCNHCAIIIVVSTIHSYVTVRVGVRCIDRVDQQIKRDTKEDDAAKCQSIDDRGQLISVSMSLHVFLEDSAHALSLTSEKEVDDSSFYEASQISRKKNKSKDETSKNGEEYLKNQTNVLCQKCLWKYHVYGHTKSDT